MVLSRTFVREVSSDLHFIHLSNRVLLIPIPSSTTLIERTTLSTTSSHWKVLFITVLPTSLFCVSDITPLTYCATKGAQISWPDWRTLWKICGNSFWREWLELAFDFICLLMRRKFLRCFNSNCQVFEKYFFPTIFSVILFQERFYSIIILRLLIMTSQRNCTRK